MDGPRVPRVIGRFARDPCGSGVGGKAARATAGRIARGTRSAHLRLCADSPDPRRYLSSSAATTLREPMQATMSLRRCPSHILAMVW